MNLTIRFRLQRYTISKGFFQNCKLEIERCRKTFNKSSNQSKEGAFPLMRMMTLMSLSTRWILDVEYAPYKGKKTGEHSLMRRILDRLPCEHKRFLFHFDALFYSFALVYQLGYF